MVPQFLLFDMGLTVIKHHDKGIEVAQK